MANWIRVASTRELVDGKPFRVEIPDRDSIALYRVKDQIYATEDLCSHAEASLTEGDQRGHVIECPQHGGEFDVRTGKALRYPAFSAIATFPVRLDGEDVYVDVDA